MADAAGTKACLQAIESFLVLFFKKELLSRPHVYFAANDVRFWRRNPFSLVSALSRRTAAPADPATGYQKELKQ
jgi:hypothetical protein